MTAQQRRLAWTADEPSLGPHRWKDRRPFRDLLIT